MLRKQNHIHMAEGNKQQILFYCLVGCWFGLVWFRVFCFFSSQIKPSYVALTNLPASVFAGIKDMHHCTLQQGRFYWYLELNMLYMLAMSYTC